PAEVVGLVAHDLDLEHVAGLGATHIERPGERVGKRVDRQEVIVGRVACDGAVAGVAQLEGHLVARLRRGGGGDVRVPAVVPVGRAAIEARRTVYRDAQLRSRTSAR